MYSFHDLNLPTILFVARPADSRKGLQTFLDAVACLSKLENLPPFSVWILGGTPSEANYVRNMVQCRQELTSEQMLGKVVIWGRVAHEALPEFYSRSTVVVMPSTREQFGLVSIEAMMCGAPVVANRAGGLVDAVVDGFTGILLETNDSCLLASVLSGYLRNPARRDFHGRNAREWACFAFSQNQSYSAIEHLYSPGEIKERSAFHSYEQLQQRQIATLARKAADLLGEPALNTKDLSSGVHTSFKLQTTNGSYFLKSYALEPSMNACVFNVTKDLCAVRTFAEYAGKCRFHAENAAAPRPLMYMAEESMVIFEWCEPLELGSSEDEMKYIADVASRYREYRPPESTPELSAYIDALRHLFVEPNNSTLTAFDLAGVELNAVVCGGVRRFLQTHPQAELLRYRHQLTRRNWALPDAFSMRTMAVLEYLLSLLPGLVASPRMCNGSLKGEHLLRGPSGLVACDIDSCRYAVGPLDEAHYIFKRILRQGVGPTQAISELQAMLPGHTERYLGLCWIVVDLIYEALARLTEGKYHAMETFMKFSNYLFEACFESFGQYKSENVCNALAMPVEEIRNLV